jgi:WD40 repeat protein
VGELAPTDFCKLRYAVGGAEVLGLVEITKCRRQSDWAHALAFSPDGKVLASASGGKTVKLSDTGTGAAPETLKTDAIIQSFVL